MRGRPDWGLLVIVVACLMPLAIFTLAWGVDWLLNFGNADNWSYVKYFMDWTSPDPVLRSSMASDYKGARVAWILLGYLAFQALGPLAGTIVLNAAVGAFSILAVLALTCRLFGRPAGALATIILAAYAGFYSTDVPGFWSYHGVFCGLAYTLFLLALAEVALRRGSARWAAVAGFTGALAVVTTTNYLVALPSALVFWLVLRGLPPAREIATLAVFGLGGGLLCLATLAGVNVLAGGPAYFFWSLIEVTMRSAGGDSGRPPLAAWLPRATWLVFPFVALVGGLVTLAARIPRRGELRDEQRAFVAAFAGFVVLWGTHFLLQATIGIFVEAPHYNYVVLAPAALVLAGTVRCLPRGRGGEWRIPAYAFPLVAVLLTLPQVLVGPAILAEQQASLNGLVARWHLSAALVIGVLLGMLGLAIVASGVAVRQLAAAALCIGVAWNVINPYGSLVTMPPACRIERDNFLLVMDVAEWLGSRGLHADPRSWFSTRDVQQRPNGCPDSGYYLTYLAVEQVGMIWKVTSPDPLPERIADLPRTAMRHQVEARRRAFVIVLSPPEAAAALDKELSGWAASQPVYIRPRPVRRETFARGPLSLTVQVYGTGQRARRFDPSQTDQRPDD